MSNSKLKNKTVEPSVQEVPCPVSGIYFSSIGVDFHAQILVCHSQRYDPDSKSLCALELPANSLNSLLSGLSRRIRKSC